MIERPLLSAVAVLMPVSATMVLKAVMVLSSVGQFVIAPRSAVLSASLSWGSSSSTVLAAHLISPGSRSRSPRRYSAPRGLVWERVGSHPERAEREEWVE